MSNPTLSYNSLQEFSEILGIYDSNPEQSILWSDYPDESGFGMTERRATVGLNDLIGKVSFAIFKKDVSTEARYGRQDGGNDAVKILLNSAVPDITESAYTLIKQARLGNKHKTVSPATIFNAISNILNTNTAINNKVASLVVFEDLLRRENQYYGTEFLPDFVNCCSGRVYEKFVPINLTVKDFSASEMSMDKKTGYPTIYSALENFTLLKSEIEKIETGLYTKIEDVINKLLASADYNEFVTQALIFYSIVDPFTNSQLKDTSIDIEGIQIGLKVPALPTLTSKFKLDCACHTHSDQWKLCTLPTILNTIFLMNVK